MTYRGPDASRISGQFVAVQHWAGASVTWRAYVSAATTGSAYWAGGGQTRYYAERAITAMLAAPQDGEARFRETQLPAGQIIAGDLVASTLHPLGQNDQVVWRGVTYRVESDAVPVYIGGKLFYRTVLRRGDVTG